MVAQRQGPGDEGSNFCHMQAVRVDGVSQQTNNMCLSITISHPATIPTTLLDGQRAALRIRSYWCWVIL